MKLPWLLLLVSFTALGATSNDLRHRERNFGIEVNILWPFEPFRTTEVKFLFPIAEGGDLVLGWGRQNWTIGEGASVNPGTMDSHALILGVKQFIAHTSAVVEYDAWLAHDRLKNLDGSYSVGWSWSNEFFIGNEFYLGNTFTTITPGINAGFWAYKTYPQKIDDRFIWTVLPKVNAGFDFH